MHYSYSSLIALYQKHKEHSLCLDIETCFFNGPISIIGIYKPQNGHVSYSSFIKGSNLSPNFLEDAFKNCRLLITYNGIKHDIPKIRAEFPKALPNNIKILDVYLLAKELGLGTNLTTLENTLCIERPDAILRKRRAIQMWKAYEKYNDQSALNKLIEYNREDTINLYPILESLIKKTETTQTSVL